MTFLRSLTPQLRLIIGAALVLALIAALAGAYWKGRADGRAIERASAAEIARKATEEARGRDEAAREAVDAGKASAGAEIERGRDAAKDADDPWKAATEAMR